MKQEEMVQVGFKLSPSVLSRIDKAAERLSQTGTKFGRSDILRIAVHQWLEAEGKKR